MSVCNWHLEHGRQPLATLAMRLSEASETHYYQALDRYHNAEGMGSMLGSARFAEFGAAVREQ